MRRLTQIANETGTDKGTMAGLAHAYTVIYEVLLANLCNLPINLMEVGLAMGGPEAGFPASRTVEDAPSVRMWHEYFPNAQIYGVDISDFSRFETEWFHFFQADCGDAGRLSAIAKKLSDAGTQFDVIVDDGSHASYHQQLTFLKFFSLIKPGGLFIIEDLNITTDIDRSLPAVPRTRELLGQILRYGRVISNGTLCSADWDAALTEIGGILISDDAYLEDLRRQFNFSAKLGENYLADGKHFSTLRRVVRGLRATWRAAAGEKLSPHLARAKLAIIQKCT
jgi:hypothetical protein